MAEGYLPNESQSARADRIYESEDIIIKARMLESEYQSKATGYVHSMALSLSAKLALSSLIAMAFDKNVVLANNPDIDIRVLRFEEALNKTKLTFSRPDVMNPGLPSMMENIRQAFRDFVSRSLNMNERKMQSERKSVLQTNSSMNDVSAGAPQQVPQKRHGFEAIGEKLGFN
jgi:hypothetical protein